MRLQKRRCDKRGAESASGAADEGQVTGRAQRGGSVADSRGSSAATVTSVTAAAPAPFSVPIVQEDGCEVALPEHALLKLSSQERKAVTAAVRVALVCREAWKSGTR